MIKRVRDLGGDIHENAVYTVVLQMPISSSFERCVFVYYLVGLVKEE